MAISLSLPAPLVSSLFPASCTISASLKQSNMMSRVCYSPIKYVIGRQEGVFTGTLSRLAQEVTDVLGKNISYVTADEHGFKLQDGSHTGCMGEIEKGNADYALMYATAPVIGENLKQGPTIGYEQMHILTVYDSNNSVVKNLDVFDSINCFQLTTWGLIALFAAIVTLFVFLGQILFRLKHPVTVIRDAKLVKLPFAMDWGWLTQSVSRTTAVATKQFGVYCFTAKDKCVRHPQYSLVVLGAFMVAIIMAAVTTERTLRDKAKTVDDYDALLQSPFKPMWFGVHTDADRFEHAPRGSVERRVFDRGMQMNHGNRSEALFHHRKGKRAVVDMRGFLRGKIAFITGQTSLASINRILCPYVVLRRNHKLRLATDARSAEATTVVAMSASLNVTQQQQTSKRVQKLFEGGILDHLARSLQTEEPNDHRSISPTLEADCMSPVTASEQVAEAPDAAYYQRLFLAMLCFFAIALLFLLMELIVHG